MMSFFALYTASSYTREAGVRNLERKIGAICRAVAVRVAERSLSSGGSQSRGKTEEEVEARGEEKEEGAESATAMAHPPEMPILVDEEAVENILGVSALTDMNPLGTRAMLVATCLMFTVVLISL